MNPRITGWLNDLAAMTAGATPLTEARGRLAVLASMLADDFPPEAFTRESLRAVGGEHTFLPTYREIRDGLEACRPKRVPSAGELSLGTRSAVQAWANAPLDERLARLRIVRRYQPTAYEHLLQTHDGALSIARQQGWLSNTQRDAPKTGAVAVPEAGGR